MAVVRGVDILIYVDTGTEGAPTWTLVGGQRNATLHEETESIDVTAKDTAGGAKDFEYGDYTWTISCDGVYIKDDTGYQALRNAIRQKKKVKVRVKTGDTYTEEGLALVMSNDLEAPYDDAATYSMELQGCGLLIENSTP